MNTLRLAAAPCCLALGLAAVAAPPSASSGAHAGYSGRAWTQDHGVLAGRCDTAAVVAIVGTSTGAPGGAGDRSTVATLDDATVGAIVGATRGRELDRIDRACIGHALELAPTGVAVAWTSSATAVSYTLTLVRDVDRRCRELRLVGRRGGRNEIATQIACSFGDGRWRIR